MIKRTIRMSPAEYINEAGVLKALPKILSEHRLVKPIIVTDKTVYPLLIPYLPENFLADHPVEFFTGSCTYAEIERLTQVCATFDVIIAFGGGQLMDTAKMVSDAIGNKLINVQTIPSNCAAVTTKSIIYSDEHEKIANARQQKPVDMVLLEPQLLLESPREYFLSGIGDTLAKYYEIRRRLSADKADQLPIEIGRFYINLCRREMLAISKIEALSEQQLLNVLDTIFLVAAAVDGIADKDGWSVVAHAFYNAYAKLNLANGKTHGEAVALGNLLQTLLEGEASQHLSDEIIAFHRRIGLPLSLADLGIETEEQIEAIARYIVRPEDFRVQTVFPNLAYEQVRSALDKLNAGL